MGSFEEPVRPYAAINGFAGLYGIENEHNLAYDMVLRHETIRARIVGVALHAGENPKVVLSKDHVIRGVPVN